MTDSDLGNVGVQREVIGYEHAERFSRPSGGAWYALLICGHKAILDVDETFIPSSHPRGRHMDCPVCTREAA